MKIQIIVFLSVFCLNFQAFAGNDGERGNDLSGRTRHGMQHPCHDYNSEDMRTGRAICSSDICSLEEGGDFPSLEENTSDISLSSEEAPPIPLNISEENAQHCCQCKIL